jgi:hypothetical protein
MFDHINPGVNRFSFVQKIIVIISAKLKPFQSYEKKLLCNAEMSKKPLSPKNMDDNEANYDSVFYGYH